MSKHCNSKIVPLCITVKLEALKITGPNDYQLFGRSVTKSRVLEIFQRFSSVSSNWVSTKRVTSKKKVAYMSDLKTLLGQTDILRVQKWKSYRPHSTMILFHVSWIRLIASTLIFAWVVQPLELFQVTASHLVLIQSKGPASPRNPRLCKAWATPPQLNISRSVMGLWTLWRTCCKVLLFELFVERHAAFNNSKQNTTMHKTITPLAATRGHVKIGNYLAPWSVTSITSICNFPAMLGKSQ